jgi:hypothetical protein
MKHERTREGCMIKRRYHNTETGQVMEEIELSCSAELTLENRGAERIWRAEPLDPWRYERKR